MRRLLRGKPGGTVAFAAIAALVAGGLGWATAAALRLERQADLNDRLRLALWRLDGRVSPLLAREDGRPYSHYSAAFAPSLALRTDGETWPPGAVVEPSPLLGAELPDWMRLHFQAAAEWGWVSPQVPPASLVRRLRAAADPSSLANVTPDRARLLAELARAFPAAELLARVRERSAAPTYREDMLLPPGRGAEQGMAQNAAVQQPGYEFQKRAGQQNRLRAPTKEAQTDNADVVSNNTTRNGEDWFGPRAVRGSGGQVSVALGPMVTVWLGEGGSEALVCARLVRVGTREVCQGIVLDWPRLETVLAGEVNDLFPAARFEPVREEQPPHPERTMTALPAQLDPGLDADAVPLGWTPLRIGLALAWAAALVALAAVGLGGWSLLNLSERRIRFVSAVTHELRTPLTTLRLYLDMLASGMVAGERQRAEYLETLNAEADRLNRLIGNVLDYSRLENQRPRLERRAVPIGELLESLRATWEGRCRDAHKELVIENGMAGDALLFVDPQLVQQVVGNLIDNACKYSRGAKDPRIWLRATPAARRRIVLEVVDRGEGVPAGDRGAIFRPFRRGRGEHATVGGAGLGLALAGRWAGLLGGRLSLGRVPDGVGACFRLELPLAGS